MDTVAVLFATMQSQIWHPFYKCLFSLNMFNLKKKIRCFLWQNMWKVLVLKNCIKFEVPVKGKLTLLIIVQCSTGYKLTEEIYSDKTNILKTSPSWFWTSCGKWEKHYYSGKFKMRKSAPSCMISQKVKFASSQCSVNATNVHHLAKQTHQP